jgi:hypothetical protein
MRGFGVVCALALALAGCGPTLGARGRVTALARADIPCETPTGVRQLSELVFEVDGCGAEVEYAGTRVENAEHFVRVMPAATVASLDTRCAVDQLVTVGPREPMRRTFSGCGATATYELQCGSSTECRWARTGEVVRAETALPLVVPPPPGAP